MIRIYILIMEVYTCTKGTVKRKLLLLGEVGGKIVGQSFGTIELLSFGDFMIK